MSSPEASVRPSQVTVAGWAIAIASVFLVVFVFDALGGLHSVEVRDDLADRISSGNLKGLGITVADAIAVKRWSLYVTGVAAAVTAILGVYVLQRDRTARIVLSIAAAVVVLAAPFTETFLAMLVGAAAAVLWSRPSRDWFAGRPITPRAPRPVERRAEPPAAPPPAPGSWRPPTSSSQPPPTLGWGAVPGSTTPLTDLPPPSAPPAYGYQPTVTTAGTAPRQVRIACILTWVFSAITALGYLVTLAAIAIDQQFLIDLVKDNPGWDPSYDDDLIVTAGVTLSIIFLLWCAGVAVVAVFTWRGAHWAWVVHVVSTVLAGIVAVLIVPYTLVHLAAIGAALGMLLSRPTRDWFASRPR